MTDYARDARDRYQMQLPWSPGKTMSSDQAAAVLDCSRETIRQMIQCGELMAYKLRKVEGSPYRIYSDSIAKRLLEINDELGVEDIEAYMSAKSGKHAKGANRGSTVRR